MSILVDDLKAYYVFPNSDLTSFSLLQCQFTPRTERYLDDQSY